MLIVGSWALHQYGLTSRMPRDFDVIINWNEFQNKPEFKSVFAKYPISNSKWVVKYSNTIWDCDIAWSGTTSAELLERTGDRGFATPEECLALKLSHRYLKNSPHFYKTRNDILMLRAKGFKLDAWLSEWVKRREKETYWYQHPNLDRTKTEFFRDDGIKYEYDHDSLHKAVAIDEQPAYKYFQVNGKEVLTSMRKFEELPLRIRLNAVWEECAVLALERSVIPCGGHADTAFQTALMKVCTSITSGKFREFAWENHDKVLELNAGRDYVEMFSIGLKNKVVRPHETI